MRNLAALALVFLVACGSTCDFDGWAKEGHWDECRAPGYARLRKSIAVQADFPVRFSVDASSLGNSSSLIEMSIGSSRWPVRGYTIVDSVITQTSDVTVSGNGFIIRSVSLLPREP